MADERDELPPLDNEGIPEGDAPGPDDSDSNIPLIVLGKGDGTRILRPQEYEENQRKLQEEQQQEQPQASEEAPEMQYQEQPQAPEQAPAISSQEQPVQTSSRGGLVGGFVAGLLIGAVATFAVLTYVIPPKSAPATASEPPPAASTEALDNAKAEIAKLKARIAGLEKTGTQQAGTKAELDKAKAALGKAQEELAQEKARADALQVHNAKLMETVRTVRSVFESVNVKGKRDTVFGPDGATKDKK